MYGLAFTGAPILVYALIGVGLVVTGAIANWRSKR
jgi:hypothetical protein